MVTLDAPDYPSLAHICASLRPADREEIYGVLDHDSPDILARQVLDCCRMGRGVIARSDGEPVAFLGYAVRHPTLGEAFAGGTEKFPMAAMTLTRYALKVMKPELLQAGIRRLQCQSLATHVEAHRWLGWLGFRRECLLREYGRGGKDYWQFVALASDFNLRSDSHLLQAT